MTNKKTRPLGPVRHVDLFSGIGGFSLAGRMIWGESHNVEAFVEKDSFCQSILSKHWPTVPIYEDIKEYSGRDLRGEIDIVSGGFPCQPYSVAGSRRASQDDRALWPEMLRIISEVRPRWVVGENVTGLVKLGLDGVLSSLEAEGYSVEALVIPACAVDAPHKRGRIWILANSDGYTNETLAGVTREESRLSEEYRAEVMSGRDVVRASAPALEHSDGERLKKRNAPAVTTEPGLARREPARFWSDYELLGGRRIKSGLCPLAYGISGRVARLRALGNAIVPQLAAEIFAGIEEIRREEARA